MSVVFFILFLLFFVTLIIGLINPSLVVRKGRNTPKRRRVALTGGLLSLFFMGMWIVTLPNSNSSKTMPPTTQTNKSTGKAAATKSSKTSSVKQASLDDIAWYKKNQLLTSQLSNGIGLGDSIAWITNHDGNPSTSQVPPDKAGTGEDAYDGNSIQVSYMYGRTYFYEKDYDVNSEIGLAEAKVTARAMMPKDAVYTGKEYWTNVGGAQEHIYIYRSDSLIKLFPADMFANKDGVNQPGVFDVAYQYDTLNNPNKIMGVITFISDNP